MSDRPTIQPDTKDWTWVLERPCPECGLESGSIAGEQVPDIIRRNVSAWVDVLGGDDVGRRPRPDVWSPLEYACHVRDVLRLYDERLQLMLDQDDPLYSNWDQDATAVAERYWEQHPSVVADQLRAAGHQLADRFAAVRPEQWARTGRRSDGAVFTVESFARYFVHDVVHHLHDVSAPE